MPSSTTRSTEASRPVVSTSSSATSISCHGTSFAKPATRPRIVHLEEMRDARVVAPRRKAAAAVGDDPAHLFVPASVAAGVPAVSRASPARRQRACRASRAPRAGRGRRAAVALDARELERDPLVDVLAPVEEAAVDEDRRRAADLQVLAELLVLRDAVRRGGGLHVGVEARDLDAELLRVAVEIGLLEMALVREERVVHLPELALVHAPRRPRAPRCRRGGGSAADRT